MASSTSVRNALEHIAAPAMVFCGVLFGGMILLTILFDPGRFPVRVDDSYVRLRDLEHEHEMLLTREQDLKAEEKRLDELAPTPTLAALAEKRSASLPIFTALVGIERARATFSLQSGNPITLEQVNLADDGTIQISGSVRDNTGRTMQLLASFVDRLREQEVYEKVSEPEYREDFDKDGIAFSPFDIVLHVAHE